MRDDQTGTYWQQITGKAISGPLKGKQLELVPADELTFALWKSEQPNGTVLKDVARYTGDYAKKDWDKRMAHAPTVISFPHPGVKDRTLMLGVEIDGVARAYPFSAVRDEKLIEDRIGSAPIVLVVGPDNQSVRVFKSHVPGQTGTPQFYRVSEVNKNPALPLVIDDATGSSWNFEGCVVSGRLKGACLERVPVIKDYWFDWRNYHAGTSVYRR